MNMIQGVRALASSNRVNRGGSFRNTARNARPANRNRNAPGNRNANLGFRPANPSPGSIDGVPVMPPQREVTARPFVLAETTVPAENRSAGRGS